MFDMKLWVYNFLIPLVFLADRQGCSTADDFSFEATFGPEDFIQQRLEDFSTKSSISGDELEDNDNFNIIGSKSIEVDVQKFNNGAIYPEIVLSEHNQLQQRKKDNEQNSAGDGTEYLTAIGSNSSKEWVTSHKKLARSTFEKHRAHHRNYRRYGHKSHKKNFAKYRKYEHSRTRKHPGVRNSFNQHPYYQGQVSYYGDTDTIDDSIYSPAKMRSHRYHHHGHHISRMDEYNRNSKWPHLSRVQYQLYEDEKEDDLPPYIKKYNRRNKQLLDLLEGTMPPPTPPQATDELLNNKKREKSQRRYHNHKNPKWIMEDLFEEQRANPNNPNSNTDEDQYVNDSASPNTSPTSSADSSDEVQKLIQQNELPGDDFSISAEEAAADKTPEESGGLQQGNSMRPHQPDASPASTSSKAAPKGNKFIYHRVDAPRVVGAGIGGPKKQRLPFVAITDRRLETSKMRQKNFEQNHLPLP